MNSDSPLEEDALSQPEINAFETAIDAFPLNSEYGITLNSADDLSPEELATCFKLIELTSSAAYKSSSRGWSPRLKKAEMEDPALRYMLATDEEGIVGFLSYMITEEDDIDVVYCYEVHLAETARSKGIGRVLMTCMEAIGRACGVEKAMLTVFTSNDMARTFYKNIGYVWYDEERIQKKRLRSGMSKSAPSYVILAKDL